MNPTPKRGKPSAQSEHGQDGSNLGVDYHLKRHRVRSTSQRRAILDALLKCGNRVTIPGLLELVRKRYPRISYATVFRAVKLFSQRGLLRDHSFGDGRIWYEVKKEDSDGSHGHLVCIACAKILEFNEPGIATFGERAAKEVGFVLSHQHHVLYGVCPECRTRRLRTT